MEQEIMAALKKLPKKKKRIRQNRVTVLFSDNELSELESATAEEIKEIDPLGKPNISIFIRAAVKEKIARKLDPVTQG